MCTLYSQVKGQAEIRAIIDAIIDSVGNLAPQPAIFPDQLAPIVRETAKERELIRARWGMPGPAIYNTKPITNVRHTSSKFWQSLLKIKQRCLVPATSFCEYNDIPDPKTKRKTPNWFAVSEERPLFFFAGVWREWDGTRGTKTDPIVGRHLLFSFLTTEPNSVVRPVHAKAMPVILTKPEEWRTWLTAPAEEALKLQRPLDDKLLKIVASGEKKDAP